MQKFFYKHLTQCKRAPAALFNAVLPPRCLLCNASGSEKGACKACLRQLPWISAELSCPACALFSPDGQLCGACLRETPAFDHTLAALRYEWPVDQLVQVLKYRGDIALARPLGRWMSTALVNAPRPDALIAMPLHPRRQRERGFNQSIELARMIQRATNIPLLLDACQRERDTEPQASLPWKDRRKQIRGAFRAKESVAGQHIALIDDVMTTGASMNELAQTLKDAGAKRVDCWLLARTMKQDGGC